VVPGYRCTNLVRVAMAAYAMGVPRDLVPFGYNNGDYFCINQAGKVVYWDHNILGLTGEKRPDLATWIEQAWILGR